VAESTRKPLVDNHALLDLLHSRFGPTGTLTPISEGEESRAFCWRTDGEDLILRINRDRLGFDKDAFVAGRLSTPALPIPEVLEIGSFGDVFFCLSRHMPGSTLQSLPQGAAFAYGRPVCGLLDQMAAVMAPDTTGFGPFDETGHAEYAAWQDFMLAPRQWSTSPVARDERQLVHDALDAIEMRLPRGDIARRLVHGDFGSNNVLVADGRITGLIDWSEAMWGDPLYDLANILFWRPWLDCMEQQCRYLEAHEPARLADRDRLTAYQLRIGLETLRDAVVHADTDFAGWAINRCRQILADA
jgi:hygromycin-B 4-O-kinase